MLEERTLVLNRHWTAISTTTVRRALVLVVRGAAGVVHPETFRVDSWDSWIENRPSGARVVRGFGFDVPLPEVIVLSRYEGYPTRGVAFTRRNVYRRDGYACQYCRARPGVSDLTIDHVIPRSRGGPSTWDNCVTACRSCNARKSNRTLHEAEFRLERSPVAPRWPGGLDPQSVHARPLWRRFVPSHAVAVGA